MPPNNNDVWIIAALVASVVAYYYLQVFRRSKKLVRFKVRRILVYLICLCLGIPILTGKGYTVRDAALFSMFVGISAAFILIRAPNNNRRIPSAIRRAVIARDLKGERFNAAVHDIDHIVPYSKGGDHSLENLRVIGRSQNRKRGAKMPKFRDFT